MNKLLIANRGEIALRIIRSARALGIRTVAVCSQVDEESPFTRNADEYLCIGAAAAADSYLNAEKIIQAAKTSGADAIHPGYGFLAENPQFAEMVVAAGLTFVGPPPNVMRRLGLKDEARKLAAEIGIPIPIGVEATSHDSAQLFAAAENVGFPLLIKASAGGGGKGMRKVDSPDTLLDFVARASGEAASAFGNGRLFFEQIIFPARHIEVQLIADSFGNVVHLFERDCSLQRRYQKFLEICPAEGLSKKVRESICQAAVSLAKHSGLVGAATAEFLIPVQPKDYPDAFYFLEVNPRIQVEHPITEMVTGLDIVELQLRIARGEQLPLKQKAIKVQGASIQARVSAELPSQNFRPTSGRIHDLVLPVEVDSRLRIEHGLAEGLVIGTHYDSLVMKVIVHEADHQLAKAALHNALNQIAIHGLETNIPFLQAVLRQEELAVDTTFIDQHINSLLPGEAVMEAARFALAATLLFRAGLLNSSRSPQLGSPFDRHLPLREAQPLPLFEPVRRWHLRCGYLRKNLVVSGRLVEMLGYDPAHVKIEIEGKKHQIWIDSSANADAGWSLFKMDDVLVRVIVDTERLWSEEFTITTQGFSFAASLAQSHVSAAAGAQDSQKQIIAQLPGRVIEVKVKAGDSVKMGDTCVVIESMKMEHSLTAPVNVQVKEVFVRAGSTVKEGDVLVDFAVTSPRSEV